MISSRLFWILVATAVGISAWRVVDGQVDLRGMGQEQEYAFDLTLDVGASVGDFDLADFVPRTGPAVEACGDSPR